MMLIHVSGMECAWSIAPTVWIICGACPENYNDSKMGFFPYL